MKQLQQLRQVNAIILLVRQMDNATTIIQENFYLFIYFPFFKKFTILTSLSTKGQVQTSDLSLLSNGEVYQSCIWKFTYYVMVSGVSSQDEGWLVQSLSRM